MYGYKPGNSDETIMGLLSDSGKDGVIPANTWLRQRRSRRLPFQLDVWLGATHILSCTNEQALTPRIPSKFQVIFCFCQICNQCGLIFLYKEKSFTSMAPGKFYRIFKVWSRGVWSSFRTFWKQWKVSNYLFFYRILQEQTVEFQQIFKGRSKK